MTNPHVPRNTNALIRAFNRIFEGVNAPQGDYQEVIRYMNEELPRFEQAETSYLVLGSYRGEYGRRLRRFAHWLNMPTNAESIVLGDTLDLDTAVIPEFDIKINLLAEAADAIAGIYEKESGGESPELGIVRALFLHKTHVFPRDYAGLTRDNLDTRDDVIGAALEIYYSDADDDMRREQLLSLLQTATEEGIDISERELTDILKQREAKIDEPPSEYSWVHLSFFKRFEVADQCHPWTTLSDLDTVVDEMPGPTRPRWETEFDPSVFLDG